MVEIVTYSPKFKPAFIALNRGWIEHYFRLEPMDLMQLENLEEHILDPGGEIFIALLEGEPVGVCALIPHGTHSFELAKMAVSSEHRGHGIGDALIKFCLTWARDQGATSISLLSNTILSPAINLYKKHGFQTTHLGPHPDYDRCDIEMSLVWS